MPRTPGLTDLDEDPRSLTIVSVLRTSSLPLRAFQEATATLVAIMRDQGAPPRARSAAAETLLNRGWGAPTQHVEMDVREQPPLLPYTDEELLQRLQAHVDEKRERANRVH